MVLQVTFCFDPGGHFVHSRPSGTDDSAVRDGQQNQGIFGWDTQLCFIVLYVSCA